MENENEQQEVEDVSEETLPVEETTTVEEPNDDSVVLSKADFNKLNRKAIAYEATKKNPPAKQDSYDSIDQIKLGKKLHDYSDEELDFVTDAAGSKDPTKVLKTLENPYIQAGIKAIREKVEKEKLALTPSGTQSESDKPRSLNERLANANLAEKEQILRDAGLYKENKRRTDAVYIGQKFTK